jgi:hypothetical protein
MTMHAHPRRAPQDGNGDRDAFTASSIFFSRPAEAPTGALATADVTTFTTATGAFAIETTVNGVVTITTSSGEVVITNAADYSSIVSAESASRAADAAARTTSEAAATESASSGGSNNNLGTLIPAIVVPIVVVLLASFGGFWWWMRRRHRKELKNTDFAMAGKGEKLTSRSNSSRAGTAPSASEKNATVTVNEVAPPRPYASDHPKDSFEAIGLARAPGQNEPRNQDSRPQSPKMPFSGGRDGPQDRGFQNFSGPRPSTARRPPPSHGPPQGRNRSNSSPGNRGPPPGAGPWPRPGPGQRGPPPPRDIGPSPIMRNNPPPPGNGTGQPHSLHANPRPAPAPPTQTKLRAASPTSGINRSNVPAALDSPPPGAFNGASPISQYSPIVKETPNIGSVATFGTSPPRNVSSRDGSRPPPIITTDIGTGLGVGPLAVTKEKSRSPSPRSPEESFLTEENMRIARLANSSRLGFNQTSKPGSPGPNAQRPVADFSKPLGYKRHPSTGQASPLLPINTAHSAPGQSPAATSVSNPSPKLPPPATLSQLIPSDSPRDERKPQWNYFGAPPKVNSPTSSVYSGPAAGHSRPLPNNARSNLGNDTRDDDQKSEVSDLDAYEDIDAKSDVSSLNEFERFDFDSRHGSRPTSSSIQRMGR